MVHTLADCAGEGGKGACVTDGVECVTGCKRFAKGIGSAFKEAAKCLHDGGLRLLHSDKAGEFAVLEESQTQEKAEATISKNFLREVGGKEKHLKKMRTSAENFCNEFSFDQLAKATKSSQVSLQRSFKLKTHKEGNTFKTIVAYRGTWHRIVAAFLQRHFKKLPVDDSIFVRNSDEVVECTDSPGISSFSVDGQNLFCSVPQDTDVSCRAEY
ncbi:hypothetical protein HPB48_009880 [Haemaphysalis longicornis]|uniref:Uncharacterized protein n=1 Tax=Haemaphysalis longicornis TaxID=44386 RepID=A0A9J6GIH0_HAELO|nr:hypothetical protein HPB48_009880 [Haemaphysalis longicornis]